MLFVYKRQTLMGVKCYLTVLLICTSLIASDVGRLFTSLYILDINPLSDTCFEDIFFILWVVFLTF